VCTGNYYRSRFAEILFNALSEQQGLYHQAFSKGLRLSKNNKGPISKHCIAYFSEQYPNLKYDLRMPIPFDQEDFDFYDSIILMDKTEHHPMIEKRYPEQQDKVTYWNIVDDYIKSPEDVLPILEKKIIELTNELKNN
jgi:protein-tyrosine phosphatase